MRQVHIHIQGATVSIIRPTRDKAPTLAQLYADLTDRLMQAYADLMGHKTKDEGAGHPFHGNQYVNGISGPKPTSTVATVKKHAIHELLSSGHPWTVKELMDITGHDNEKTIKSWLTMFKSEKYAGSKGALNIEKNPDGTYQVVMADGKPAPVLEAIKETPMADLVKKPKYNPTLAEALGKAPTPAEAMAKFADPEPALADDLQPVKAVADKYYAAEINAATNDLIGNLIAADDKDDTDNALLNFKDQKAHAMASWAEAMGHGTKKPVKQQLFQADHQLGKDLMAMPTGKQAEIDQIMSNWKSNTAKEKQGLWPAKPATAATAKPEAKASVQVAKPVDVAPIAYDSLVPKGFKQISADDLTKKDGFQTGILKLKAELNSMGGENSIKNKKSVEQRLRERLKDSPNFQAFKELWPSLKDHGPTSLEARLVSTWAGSSGDGNPLSVAMQLAVRDVFNMPKADVEHKQLSALKAAGDNEALVYRQAVQALTVGKTMPDAAGPLLKSALKEFAKAQYHETQDALKAAGFDHVYVARGMKFQHDVDPNGGAAPVRMQPASSFSANYGTAKSFSGGGTVFLVKVPREQVLGTYVTGFGCTSEHEVVVLSHKGMKAFTVPWGAAASPSQAAEHVKGRIKVTK